MTKSKFNQIKFGDKVEEFMKVSSDVFCVAYDGNCSELRNKYPDRTFKNLPGDKRSGPQCCISVSASEAKNLLAVDESIGINGTNYQMINAKANILLRPNGSGKVVRMYENGIMIKIVAENK